MSTFPARSPDNGGDGGLVLVPLQAPRAGPSSPDRCKGPDRWALTETDQAETQTVSNQSPLTRGPERRHG